MNSLVENKVSCAETDGCVQPGTDFLSFETSDGEIQLEFCKKHADRRRQLAKLQQPTL